MNNKKSLQKIAILLLLCIFCFAAYAEDAAQELEGISVIGNQELPKALVIVPWKSPEPGELGGKPIQSLIDEVLGPVDKEVHKRKVSYYEQYH